MKVILLKDVKNIGKKDEIVEVNNSYGRNVLVAKGLAVEANAKSLNDLKLQKKNADKIASEQLAEAIELKKKIDNITVEVYIKSGKDGKTFGSVSSKEIVSALLEQFNIELDKKKLVLNENIKVSGLYKINVKLHKEVLALLTVNVIAK